MNFDIWDKLEELENDENDDIQLLLRAFKIMRGMAIGYIEGVDQVPFNGNSIDFVDNDFEERMSEQ
jgi:hypothetical protein